MSGRHVSLDALAGEPRGTAPGLAYADLMAERDDDKAIAWPRLTFDQTLFILFSWGAKRPPKCIIHGADGTLLEHGKEQQLHRGRSTETRGRRHLRIAG